MNEQQPEREPTASGAPTGAAGGGDAPVQRFSIFDLSADSATRLRPVPDDAAQWEASPAPAEEGTDAGDTQGCATVWQLDAEEKKAPKPGAADVVKKRAARDREDMHFPIILNGLDYLHSSLTSLADQPQGRDLKYAVLHLQLGTETLLKARLEMEDPRLVWSRPQSYDETRHQLGTFHSVGVEKALVRLRDDVKIKNPIDPEDTDLKELAALRNRLTHYGASDTATAVEARTVPVLKKLLPFLDDELLPHAHSDDATAAHELMEQIRPLIGKVDSFVQLRIDELAPVLKDKTERTLRCVSCGHFTLPVQGEGKETFLCLMCGKDHGTIDDMVELHGVGSFHQAHTEGGEPPAYECSECASGDTVVLPVATADSPEGGALLCLFGGHVLEGVCEQCRRACDFVLAELCSDCVGNRYARF